MYLKNKFLILFILFYFTGCSFKYGVTYKASKKIDKDGYHTYVVTKIGKYPRGPHNIDGILPFPKTVKTTYIIKTKKLGWVDNSDVKFYQEYKKPKYNIKLINKFNLDNARFFFSKDKLIIENIKICNKYNQICTTLDINKEYNIENNQK